MLIDHATASHQLTPATGRRHMLTDRNPPIRATARPCAALRPRVARLRRRRPIWWTDTLAGRARRMGCIATDRGDAQTDSRIGDLGEIGGGTWDYGGGTMERN